VVCGRWARPRNSQACPGTASPESPCKLHRATTGQQRPSSTCLPAPLPARPRLLLTCSANFKRAAARHRPPAYPPEGPLGLYASDGAVFCGECRYAFVIGSTPSLVHVGFFARCWRIAAYLTPKPAHQNKPPSTSTFINTPLVQLFSTLRPTLQRHWSWTSACPFDAVGTAHPRAFLPSRTPYHHRCHPS
jgi:hypothetical protein